MNVLVTGGTGFIGSHLANRIKASGHKVCILSKTGAVPGHMAVSEFTWVKGDFGDAQVLDQALSGVDVVIHLAWTSVPNQDIHSIETDVQQNITGTVALLNRCVAHTIKKFIFISSGGTVYGIPKEIPIREEHSLYPISSYGVSKVAVEKYLHLYHSLFGLDYLVFRVSNAYGEYQNLQKGQGVLGIWLDNIVSGKELAIWGDGNVTRDYIYIDDVVAIIAKAVDHDFAEKIYNLGFGGGVSLNELVELIKMHLTEKISVNYYPGREIDVPVNILDISKLRNETGFSPTISLAEGLGNVWKWIVKGH